MEIRKLVIKQLSENQRSVGLQQKGFPLVPLMKNKTFFMDLQDSR